MRNLAGGLAKIMTAAAIVIVRVVCACASSFQWRPTAK